MEYNLSSHFQTEEKSSKLKEQYLLSLILLFFFAVNRVLLKKSHEYSSDSLRFVVCPDLYMKTRVRLLVGVAVGGALVSKF